MRPLADVEHVLRLASQGLSAYAIEQASGISRKTVLAWLADPDHAISRRLRASEGWDCSGGCEMWLHVPKGTYAYVLGMYLGDGHIIRQARTYKLSIYCDRRYEAIIEEISTSLARLIRRKVGLAEGLGCVEVRSHSQHWPCLFPQHGPGRKHDRPIRLLPWQRDIVQMHTRPFLRGLVQSDGCRVVNRVKRPVGGGTKEYQYPRYFFSNESADIRGLFCDACDSLDVPWGTSKWGRDITVQRREAVAFLDSFIGPKR